MAIQTITVRDIRVYASFTPGVRPPTLLRREEFVNVPDGIRLIGDGGPVSALPEIAHKTEEQLARVGGPIELLVRSAGGGGQVQFTFAQPTPASTWTITHGLNRFPDVVLIDTARDEFDASINYVDPNTIIVTTVSPVAGTAYLS